MRCAPSANNSDASKPTTQQTCMWRVPPHPYQGSIPIDCYWNEVIKNTILQIAHQLQSVLRDVHLHVMLLPYIDAHCSHTLTTRHDVRLCYCLTLMHAVGVSYSKARYTVRNSV